MAASPNRRRSVQWWDADTIERTVTRQFVCSHLIPTEIEKLDQPLGFGDGLTDGTYWEWIEEKAKKIFLILAELRVPDQIFGVIDDSWDDEDLPIALDQVDRLALTPDRDDRFDQSFYDLQFRYLVQPLRKGEHKIYQDPEVVPLEVVEKRNIAGQSLLFDKVILMNHPGTILSRLRMPLGNGHISQEDFLFEVNGIRAVHSEHLASYWGSYIHQGFGYVLFTQAAESSLKSFLTTTPSWVKNLEKQARRRMVMDWIHCLVDTICFLHSRGLSHGNIKPSTVMFTNDNEIFFSNLLGDMVDKSSFDKESYDYAAPEQWFKPSSFTSSSIAASRRGTVTSSFAHSPDSNVYTISRSPTDSHSPVSLMLHAPTPHLSPQAADIFSLGCVILDLLSFVLKKHGRPFATHRAAKHKTPGRGGAVPDSSFHKNLGQVESWMTQLAKDAAKKDDPIFKAVAPMLHVVEHMLSAHPSDRPPAKDVQSRMYQIITNAETCGISEPHCVHQYYGGLEYDGSWRLASNTAAEGNEAMSILTRRSSGGSGHHYQRKRSSAGSVVAGSGSGSEAGMGTMGVNRHAGE
ncbi:kinase-like domain-containing protein [Cladorrhinum samala]|uniref:Kinase-like domain-containing protein n=1 Tax=Cladorrhinum samala TaxID=585594 RepID=A0AAV9HD13_9PEZI|nr:kinase-like domain-containing protein [Cladorrhinum samala]